LPTEDFESSASAIPPPRHSNKARTQVGHLRQWRRFRQWRPDSFAAHRSRLRDL